jgi:hypothetical protein
MRIDQLLNGGSFGPAQREILRSAFHRTLCILNLADNDGPICDLVARKILEIGSDSPKTPAAISNIAIRELGVDYSVNWAEFTSDPFRESDRVF